MGKFNWKFLDTSGGKMPGGLNWFNGGGSDYGYSFQPYNGPEPHKPMYLEESADDIYPMLAERSKGIGVGYDPKRRQAQEALIRSGLDKREEDEVRGARGIASRAGLSGNLRAQEAMEGRVRRDIGRTYGDAVTQISIEDLARANQERDVNTARLQRFNEFQFGQSNAVADWNLRKWAQEQGLQMGAAGAQSQLALADRARGDEMISDLLGTGVNVASMVMAPEVGVPMMALETLGNRQGYGVAPGGQNQGGSNITNDFLDWKYGRKTRGY